MRFDEKRKVVDPMKRKLGALIAVILALCMLLPCAQVMAAGVQTGKVTANSVAPTVKYTELELTGGAGKDISSDAKKITSASEATFTFIFKRTGNHAERQELLSISNAAGDSAVLYLSGSRAGFEVREKGSEVCAIEDDVPALKADTFWYNITVTFSGKEWSLFIDGEKVFTKVCVYGFNSVTDPVNAVIGKGFIGSIDTFEMLSEIKSDSDIAADAYLTAKEYVNFEPYAYRDEKDTVIFEGSIYNNTPENIEAMDSAVSFRIPSLIRSITENPGDDDVLIASIDKANVGMDWGDIDVAVRRSFDGGKTWEKTIKTVLDLPTNVFSTDSQVFKSAFAIDPQLAMAENGDILIIVDVYPESKGLHAPQYLEQGAGYVTIDGKTYLALYNGKSKIDNTAASSGSAYTVRENGWVYDPNGMRTNYYVPQNHSADIAFETMGDMYYCVGEPDYIYAEPPVNPTAPTGDEDIYVGNIYLETGNGDINSGPKFVQKQYYSIENGDAYNTYTTDAAPLRVGIISQLWVLRSSDNGATWSQPVDITSQVMATNGGDSAFLGTGPGVAITLKHQSDPSKNGRIVAPVYTTGSNSAAAIYSDDNGHTWHRCLDNKANNIDETQLVELMNGTIVCFGRQSATVGKENTPVTYSYDGGETWSSRSTTSMKSVRCQKSIITYPFDSDDANDETSDKRFDYPSGMTKGKQYVIASHPSGTGSLTDASRKNGLIELGEVQSDNSIKWIASRAILIPGQYDGLPDGNNFFAYSCLTVLENGNIGIHYESQAVAHLSYAEFNLEWILGNTDSGYVSHDIRAPRVSNVSLSLDRANQQDSKLAAGDVINFEVALTESVFSAGNGQISFTVSGEEKTADFVQKGCGNTLVFSYTVRETDDITQNSVVKVLPGFGGEQFRAEGARNAGVAEWNEAYELPLSFGADISITPLTYISDESGYELGNKICEGTVLVFESAAMKLKSKPVCVSTDANITLTETNMGTRREFAVSGTASEGNLAFEVIYTDGKRDYKTIVYTYVRQMQRNAHGQTSASEKYGGLLGLGGTQVDNQTVHTVLNSEGSGGSGYFVWDGLNTWKTGTTNTSGSTAAGLTKTNSPVPQALVIADKSLVSDLSEVLKVESALGRTTSVSNFCDRIIIFEYGQRSGSSTSYTYYNPETGHSNTYTSNDGSVNIGTVYGAKAVRSISGPVENAKFTLQMNTNIEKNESAGNTYVMIDVEVKVVDKGVLREAVERCKNLNPQSFEYTEDSLVALNAAYSSASAVLNDNRVSNQNTIDSAAEALIGALDSLKKISADYTALDDAIASVPADLSIYTDVTAQAVRDALAVAEAVSRDLTAADQDIIDAAAKALADAVAALEEKPAAKPELVASNGAVVDDARGFVYGIEIDLGYEVRSCFEATNGGSINVIPTAVGEETATGAVLQLIDADGTTVLAEYTVIIFGDANGNGYIDTDDSDAISNAANYLSEAIDGGSPEEFAGDINASGYLDTDDSDAISNTANYLSELSQVEVAQLFYIG